MSTLTIWPRSSRRPCRQPLKRSTGWRPPTSGWPAEPPTSGPTAGRPPFVLGGPEDGHIDDIDATVVASEFRDSPTARRVLTLVNYSCHPTGSRESVSTSDYPGHTRRTVSAATGAPCMFVNGAGGDVNQRFDSSGHRSVANSLQTRGSAWVGPFLTCGPQCAPPQPPARLLPQCPPTSTTPRQSPGPPLAESSPRASAPWRPRPEPRSACASSGTRSHFAHRVLNWQPSSGPDLARSTSRRCGSVTSRW